MEYIDEEKIYRIINRALTQIGKNSDEPVNKEISILKERYEHQLKQTAHPSLFDRPWVLVEEIQQAQEFCNALEIYRLATDVYIKNTPELQERDVRRLHKGLERYKEHIIEENNIIVTALEGAVRSRLPEFRNQYILEKYNKQALLIYKLKNRHKSQKSKSTDYKHLALYFFTEILNDEELKNIPPCHEKINLYNNALKIVDFLPEKKYNKTAKFHLKSQLYYAISRSALILDHPDKTRAEKAFNEHLRFKRAIHNAMEHSTRLDVIETMRRKKQEDEWKYK